MYIEKYKKDGRDYLRLVHGTETPEEGWVNGDDRKTLLDIGPYDRFDDGLPDFMGRLTESFFAGDPIIPALIPFCPIYESKGKYHFYFEEGSPDCFAHIRIFSHFLIERILEEFGLDAFFSSHRESDEIKYDIYGVFKLLLFNRLLDSDFDCLSDRFYNRYFDFKTDGYTVENVCDTLDFLYDNKDKIICVINENITKKVGPLAETICLNLTGFSSPEKVFDGKGNMSGIKPHKTTIRRKAIDRYYESVWRGPFFAYGDDPETSIVYTWERDKADLLIFMISKLILRIIRKRVFLSGQPVPASYGGFCTELSEKRIREALAKWSVSNFPGGMYVFIDIGDPDVRLILNAFDISIPQKFFKKAELMDIRNGIKIFPEK